MLTLLCFVAFLPLLVLMLLLRLLLPLLRLLLRRDANDGDDSVPQEAGGGDVVPEGQLDDALHPRGGEEARLPLQRVDASPLHLDQCVLFCLACLPVACFALLHGWMDVGGWKLGLDLPRRLLFFSVDSGRRVRVLGFVAPRCWI